MSIKRLTIFLKVMKLLVKIDSVSMLFACKRDMEKPLLTLSLILTFCQMNLQIFITTIKN
jgi:hypothetical protein